jgi:hypothetical protein
LIITHQISTPMLRFLNEIQDLQLKILPDILMKSQILSAIMEMGENFNECFND